MPAYTLAQLKGYAQQLAFLALDREKQALLDTLEVAIANGDGVRELTAAIQTTFDAGYHVFDDDGALVRVTPTKAWSTMVARTELSRAQSMGAMALYETAGIQKLQWVGADSETTCPECSAADGEIVNLGDDFENVDVDQPPAHPNCACLVIPVDEDLGSWRGSDEDRDTAARGGYSADEYEAVFGHVHPIDEK